MPYSLAGGHQSITINRFDNGWLVTIHREQPFNESPLDVAGNIFSAIGSIGSIKESDIHGEGDNPEKQIAEVFEKAKDAENDHRDMNRTISMVYTEWDSVVKFITEMSVGFPDK